MICGPLAPALLSCQWPEESLSGFCYALIQESSGDIGAEVNLRPPHPLDSVMAEVDGSGCMQPFGALITPKGRENRRNNGAYSPHVTQHNRERRNPQKMGRIKADGRQSL